mgnify:CR=1 FL=1
MNLNEIEIKGKSKEIIDLIETEKQNTVDYKLLNKKIVRNEDNNKNQKNELGNLIIDKTNMDTNKYINFINNLNKLDAEKQVNKKTS